MLDPKFGQLCRLSRASAQAANEVPSRSLYELALRLLSTQAFQLAERIPKSLFSSVCLALEFDFQPGEFFLVAMTFCTKPLLEIASSSDDHLRRGWAIVALARIPGKDVDAGLPLPEPRTGRAQRRQPVGAGGVGDAALARELGR